MNQTTEITPHQLFVPGRGIEPNSSGKQAGEVTFDSPSSGDSYDRALRAATYTAENPEISTVVFSGNHTFAMPRCEVPYSSEAMAMSRVAWENGLRHPVTVYREARAQSTFGNFVYSARLLDLARPVGVVAHDDHMERILEVGAFVLPGVTLVPITANNPERAAQAQTPSTNDMVAKSIYRIAMRGVNPGDLTTIARRDAQVARYVGGSIVAAKAASQLLRPSC